MQHFILRIPSQLLLYLGIYSFPDSSGAMGAFALTGVDSGEEVTSTKVGMGDVFAKDFRCLKDSKSKRKSECGCRSIIFLFALM